MVLRVGHLRRSKISVFSAIKLQCFRYPIALIRLRVSAYTNTWTIDVRKIGVLKLQVSETNISQVRIGAERIDVRVSPSEVLGSNRETTALRIAVS